MSNIFAFCRLLMTGVIFLVEKLVAWFGRLTLVLLVLAGLLEWQAGVLPGELTIFLSLVLFFLVSIYALWRWRFRGKDFLDEWFGFFAK